MRVRSLLLSTLVITPFVLPHNAAAAADRVRLGSASVVLPVVDHTVPFTSQAPTGNWSDVRYSEGCEEASVLMAARWRDRRGLTTEEALREIASLAGVAQMSFGTAVDSSAADTMALFKAAYGDAGLSLRYDIGIEDLKRELRSGAILIVPVEGTLLANPNYRDGGPPRHTLVVRGYDAKADAFITNDPGTSRGGGYRYGATLFGRALRDYRTGDKLAVTERRTAMIVVRR